MRAILGISVCVCVVCVKRTPEVIPSLNPSLLSSDIELLSIIQCEPDDTKPRRKNDNTTTFQATIKKKEYKFQVTFLKSYTFHEETCLMLLKCWNMSGKRLFTRILGEPYD